MSLEKLILELQKTVDLKDDIGVGSLGAWFLGPRGESQELLERAIGSAINEACTARKLSYPQDPRWVDTSTRGYQEACDNIEIHLTEMMRRLSRYSIPWYSYRYLGHMNWDNTLPAVVGYFGAMLYNQNNVAAEGGPATTALEIEVSKDICRMIGFNSDDSWGHITCGGTVANIEALWAARNTKLFPLAVRLALKQRLSKFAQKLSVKVTGQAAPKLLVDLDFNELLNLNSNVIVEIPTRLLSQENATEDDLKYIDEFTVQRLGLAKFAALHRKEFADKKQIDDCLENLAVIAPASAHYSMPKATSLLGLGAAGLIKVPIGEDARVDLNLLEGVIRERFEHKLPTLAVVVVVGSTQEGAVDDLAAILELRKKYRELGYDFLIHADAAWGGYFASLLRSPLEHSPSRRQLEIAKDLADRAAEKEPIAEDNGDSRAARQAWFQLNDDSLFEKCETSLNELFVHIPETSISQYVETQLSNLKWADSVTIDPHKAGLIPYPSGALCYRNRNMPDMVQVTAPIVFHGGEAPTMGVFGIEGSTPGAAPAAVWMSHKIIRTDQSGYGRILGRCTYNAKRLFIELISMKSQNFKLATVRRFSENELAVIRTWRELGIAELWDQLQQNPYEATLFRAIGSDLNIVPYAVNIYLTNQETGEHFINDDPYIANKFNDRVFRSLSLEFEGDEWPPVLLTGSSYEPVDAGQIISNLRSDLGIAVDNAISMNYLLSTVLNPWLSDADAGRRNMIREVGEELRVAIDKVAMSFQAEIYG